MKHLQQFIVLMGVMVLAAMHYPIPIFGQTTIGIQGGMSRATIGGEDASEEGVDMGARTGIKVGVSATIPILEGFSLQLGSNYVQKGSQVDIDDDFFDIDNFSVGLNLDYIEFSGLGIAKLAQPGGPASIYVLAGPAVAFNVKCGGVVAIGDEDGSATIKVDCDDADIKTRSVDFGITGGIGTEMMISEGMTFSVELLYTLGVKSVSEDDDIKNRAIALQIGVGFPAGK